MFNGLFRVYRLRRQLRLYRKTEDPQHLVIALTLMAAVSPIPYTPQQGLELQLCVRTERFPVLLKSFQIINSAMRLNEYCSNLPKGLSPFVLTLDNYLTTTTDIPIRLETALQELVIVVGEWLELHKAQPFEQARYYRRHSQHLEKDLAQLITVLLELSPD